MEDIFPIGGGEANSFDTKFVWGQFMGKRKN